MVLIENSYFSNLLSRITNFFLENLENMGSYGNIICVSQP